jgi:succinate dehydrogenase / fumarate reductase cytochrome b subunit
MTAHKRPLSPHLQVYRLPITGIISISHRITGVSLAIGLVLFVYILLAIACGETSYANMQSFFSLWFIQIFYRIFIFALLFHLCHGVRHLIWDTGNTFERDRLNQFAKYELIAAGLLTLFSFLIF